MLSLGDRARFVSPHALECAHFGAACTVVDTFEHERGADCAVRFDDAAVTLAAWTELWSLDDRRWPIVPDGPSCPIPDLVIDENDRIIWRPLSPFWRDLERGERLASAGSIIYVHPVRVGARWRAQLNYSARKPNAITGVDIPAEIIPPRTNLPLDAERVVALLRALGASPDQLATLTQPIPEAA